MARSSANASNQQIGSRVIQMSQDQPRGFILKGLYCLLTKQKQYNTVSFFLTGFVYIRFFIARTLSVLPENFRNWGSCQLPRPSSSYAYVGSYCSTCNHVETDVGLTNYGQNEINLKAGAMFSSNLKTLSANLRDFL